MFASLKNKIREETGSDLSKFTSKITNSSILKNDNNKERNSHRGSTSSINSLVSTDGTFKEDTSSNDYKTDSEEVKNKLESNIAIKKLESEFNKKLEQRENEWKDKFSQQEKYCKQLETEKEIIVKQNFELKEQLVTAGVYKQKFMDYQEDKEQLENFQTQEIAKVKHLVLLREQEMAEKVAALKDCNQQIDKLKIEVNRLRRQEQLLSDVQDDLESLRHSSARDLAAIASELARSEEERRHLSDLVAVLRQRSTDNVGDSNEGQLLAERKILEQRLEEAHLHLADIKTSWCEKISNLETQVGRLNRQAAEEGAERRRAIEEKEQLKEKVKQMECELECNKLEISNKDSKINRLLKEMEELSTDMKNAKSDSDEEVTFLRNQIDKLKNETLDLQSKLAMSINLVDSLKEDQKRLSDESEVLNSTNIELKNKISQIEKDLNDERLNCLEAQKELHRESSEKNKSLLRNAEISQQMEIAKQESRHKENEISELLTKIAKLESQLRDIKDFEIKANTEHDLKSYIADLEEQVAEKNKNIKTLQMKLTDMKKTLQQELRSPNLLSENPVLENPNNPSIAVISPSQSETKNHLKSSSSLAVENFENEDINFKYLKHVILKFLTSREYEAVRLIKAVATLLKFTPEEEKLVHDTLEWKMSWFGTKKPNLGIGQLAKAIPHS